MRNSNRRTANERSAERIDHPPRWRRSQQTDEIEFFKQRNEVSNQQMNFSSTKSFAVAAVATLLLIGTNAKADENVSTTTHAKKSAATVIADNAVKEKGTATSTATKKEAKPAVPIQGHRTLITSVYAVVSTPENTSAASPVNLNLDATEKTPATTDELKAEGTTRVDRITTYAASQTTAVETTEIRIAETNSALAVLAEVGLHGVTITTPITDQVLATNDVELQAVPLTLHAIEANVQEQGTINGTQVAEIVTVVRADGAQATGTATAPGGGKSHDVPQADQLVLAAWQEATFRANKVVRR